MRHVPERVNGRAGAVGGKGGRHVSHSAGCAGGAVSLGFSGEEARRPARTEFRMQPTESAPSPTPPEATTAPDATDRALRSAKGIVFLVGVIDLLGFGIVLPLLPPLGQDYLGH